MISAKIFENCNHHLWNTIRYPSHYIICYRFKIYGALGVLILDHQNSGIFNLGFGSSFPEIHIYNSIKLSIVSCRYSMRRYHHHLAKKQEWNHLHRSTGCCRKARSFNCLTIGGVVIPILPQTSLWVPQHSHLKIPGFAFTTAIFHLMYWQWHCVQGTVARISERNIWELAVSY